MSFQDIRKINIVIVAGGWSNERSVSINSGKNVFNSLKNNGYKVKFFDLKKNNLNELFNSKPDLIFNALHGEFGEDGGISCLAKKYNIPITHSDDISSALCFNKKLLKNFLKKELNLRSPKELNEIKNIKFPLIVKPNADGSSKGVKLIYNFKELKKRLIKRHKENIKIAEERILNAKNDMKHWSEYDEAFVNKNINKCSKEIMKKIDLIVLNNKKKYFVSKFVKKFKFK